MKFGLFSLRGQKAMYTNISRNGMGRFSVDIHEQEVHLELHAMDDKFQTMCRYIILTSHYSANLVMLVPSHIDVLCTQKLLYYTCSLARKIQGSSASNRHLYQIISKNKLKIQ